MTRVPREVGAFLRLGARFLSEIPKDPPRLGLGLGLDWDGCQLGTLQHLQEI